MKVVIVQREFTKGEVLYTCNIDGNTANHYFNTEAKAFIYAGLLHSVSRNDADYLARYMSKLIDGLKE